MSKESCVEIGGFEFEIDDLEYLMKHYANKNIIEEEEEEDDILLPENMHEVLVRVPAQCLYEELRFMCKAWERIISSKHFILESFSRTKHIFLVQRGRSCRRSYFMEINEKQLDYKIREFEFNCLAQFRCSCYGMILLKSRESRKVLRVLNFVTGCCLTLPECPSGCDHYSYHCALALGFDPCTNLFKVVHMSDNNNFGFEIFTIGDSSNAWKRIPGPWHDLSQRPAGLSKYYWSDPVSINGRYLYWDVSSNFILSMDVCDENCIKLKLPSPGEKIKAGFCQLVELGGQLAFLYTSHITRIDIWILQDFHSKLWIKKHTFNTKFIISSLYRLPESIQLSVRGGTSNGVLVFSHTENRRQIYLYDTKKKTMEKFTTKIKVDKLIVHRSSLFKLQQ